VIANLVSYPSYKFTGVRWLEEIPEHWELRRLRTVAHLRVSTVDKNVTEGESAVRLCNYVDVYKNDQIDSSLDFMHATATGEEIERFRLERGDVLITKDSEAWDDIGVPALVTEPASDVISGYHLALLRPRSDALLGTYLFRALQSNALKQQFHVEAKGVTRYGLSHAGIKSVWLTLPPLSEQTPISRFLDHADRRIRHYILAKQKLIALLEEQKQTLISEAVTGRMDMRTDQPYRAYKPSGVDWLKDVPQHWERRRLKTLLRSVDQRSRTGEEPLLSLRRDHGVVVYAEHFSRPPQARSLVGFKLVATGQLVVNRMQANNGLVFCSSFDGLVSPDYSVFETKKALQMEFLSDLLRTPEYLAHFRRSATGLGTGTAGFLRLYDDRFLDTIVFLPPEDEQTMVLRELSNRVATINTLIDTERRALQQIDEYRSCLVAEVITGKVDVREAVVSIAEGDPLKVEDNQEVALRREAKSGLHGSGRVAQEM